MVKKIFSLFLCVCLFFICIIPVSAANKSPDTAISDNEFNEEIKKIYEKKHPCSIDVILSADTPQNVSAVSCNFVIPKNWKAYNCETKYADSGISLNYNDKNCFIAGFSKNKTISVNKEKVVLATFRFETNCQDLESLKKIQIIFGSAEAYNSSSTPLNVSFKYQLRFAQVRGDVNFYFSKESANNSSLIDINDVTMLQAYLSMQEPYSAELVPLYVKENMTDLWSIVSKKDIDISAATVIQQFLSEQISINTFAKGNSPSIYDFF